MQFVFRTVLISLLIGALSCYPDPLDSLLSQKEITDEVSYFPASKEAITYSNHLFMKRIVEDLKDSLSKASSLEEKQDILKIFEEVSRDGMYFLWGMGGGKFKKLQEEYGNAPLIFFDAYEPLDKNGLFIRYIEGLGVKEDDRIKVLAVFDRYLSTPDVSTIGVIMFNGNNPWQNEMKTDDDDDWKEISGQLAEKVVALDASFTEKYLLDNNYDDILLKNAKIQVIGIASLPFIDVLNNYYQGDLLIYLEHLKDIIMDNRGEIGELAYKMGKDILSPPCRMSPLQWNIIDNESNDNQLSFYRRTIKYKELELLFEQGFIIRQNEETLYKIPLDISIVTAEE